jgi:hypothetical protein
LLRLFVEDRTEVSVHGCSPLYVLAVQGDDAKGSNSGCPASRPS